MSRVVSRTCTEVPDNEREREPNSRPLEAYRAAPAYVLLGDPGAGKTTAFERECEACGADGVLVSVRDFLTFEPRSRPEWREKTIFLDGLDEVRAGSSDARVPLDAIRSNLDELEKPLFRLSCREADWLGTNDRSKMAAVAPDGSLAVLRLDPLTDSDVEEILESDRRVSDSPGFIREARDRGLEGFLTNPQSLDMLAGVVADAEKWPADRLELFETACRHMAREHNDEHVAAAQSSDGAPVPIGGSLLEDVLDAAGRLCATQLIAGVAGYALTPTQESGDFPVFNRCEAEWDTVRASRRGSAGPSALLRAALAAKLFRAAFSGRFVPVHRHIAEFLGARYLAGLISSREPGQGLPARRILALIAGNDGIVVTQLRGLSAWLAAQCRGARRDLIERDPIGVGLYGDVSRFSTEEKREFLEALQRQASRLFSVDWTAAALRPLAGPTMEPTFREFLTGPRLREHPSFAWFVLHILAHGSGLPNLSSPLLGIVRDDTLPPDVNAAALEAFVHNGPHGQEMTIELKKLLADIHAERVADPNDDLLGTLLTTLYPDELSPSELWEYLSTPRKQMRLGAYHRFWATLAERCPDSHVAEHLDALVARLEAVYSMFQSYALRRLPADLLVRGLEVHGERIEIQRLYDWLGVGLESERHGHSEARDAARRIRSWLELYPQIQKSVFAEGVSRAESDADHFHIRASTIWRRLYGSRPADFGLWCLHRAMAATERQSARFYLACSLAAVSERKGDDGLSMDVLSDHTRNDPALAGMLAELRRPDDADRAVQELSRRTRQLRSEDERRRAEWIGHARDHEEALRANRGPPSLLHQLAMAYFGLLTDVEGDDPLTRLANLFIGDDGLVDAALVALRGAISRTDLPDVDEIVGLHEKSREHLLGLPFAAGLAEFDRTGEDVLRSLDDRQMRIGLAFRYCGLGYDEPAWYRRLLAVQPDLVADVLTKCATAGLRSGRQYVSGLRNLARSENHAKVARVASLRILRSFPVRCTTQQLVDLNYLLWSALRHVDPEPLSKLIDRKLARTSMNVAQRARWLAAGFVLSPETRSERARVFTERSERRIREFAAFLGDWHDAPVWINRLGATGLRVLVGVMGVSFGPDYWPSGQATMVTPHMEPSDHVRAMINRFAELPNEDAVAALEALASDQSLIRWRDELVRARDRQRVIQRDAAYRHPHIEQVCRTLNDGPPANAADLAALVRDRLDDVGRRIRTGNENGWRPYWNEGRHRRPVEPKYEDSCRDALLAHLRHGLQDAADAQPEGRYANDKRADIRVACGDFHVPVEIKKNGHRDLWSALRSQLIARYTIDPATGGYGIYLVLWFGEDAGRRTPLPASGPRPDGPGALKARLEEDLTPDEARRISVCVIDVSAPTSAAVAITGRTGSSESAP